MSPAVSSAMPPRTSGASFRIDTGPTRPRPEVAGLFLHLYFHDAELAFATFTSSERQT